MTRRRGDCSCGTRHGCRAGPPDRICARSRSQVRGSLALGLFLAIPVILVASASGESLIDLPTLAFLVVTGSWGLVQATVGALIAFRRPENRIGRLLQISGPLVISVFLGFIAGSGSDDVVGMNDPIAAIAGWWASTTLFLAIYLAFPLVGILYPDGRLPGPRWRLPILVLTLVQVAVAVVYAVAAGPVELDLPDNPFGLVAFPPEVQERRRAPRDAGARSCDGIRRGRDRHPVAPWQPRRAVAAEMAVRGTRRGRHPVPTHVRRLVPR